MKKQAKLIISIFIAVIFIITSVFYFKNNYKLDKKIEIKNDYINGTIEYKKITKEEQYLQVKDINNNVFKVNILESTIFKQKLKLEEGDKIKIKGEYSGDNNFNAIEISM